MSVGQWRWQNQGRGREEKAAGWAGKVRIEQSRGVGVERQTGQQDGEAWESVLVKRSGRHEPVTDVKGEKRKLA